MKNLHILPTDKPSRLVKIKDNLFYTTTENIPGGVYQNIYITSDEEAKEGDWGYIPFQGGDVKLVGKYFADDWKKIILTTDQDLIKDGVQSIDYKFLEWFVKNPSCEEVEVKPMLSNNGRVFYGYKIIIPKEEPKEFTTEMLVDLKQGLDNAIQKSNPLFPNYKHLNKQETLEEAAKQYAKQYALSTRHISHIGFEDGAKWQQERMYSEEDLLSAFEAGMMFIGEDKGSFKEWFEQFKKK